MIICIGREFGSGGHEIGRLLADELHYSFFDQRLLSAVTENFCGVEAVSLEAADEKRANPWLHDVNYSSVEQELRGLSVNDIVFRLQSKAILEFAAKGDAIFIGRCADYVLKNAGVKHFSIFITAPFADRVNRKMKLTQQNERVMVATVRKMDKQRKNYYNYYTSGSWGKPSSYDLCINSSTLGISDTVAALAVFINSLC